ncbi:Cof-type HAD-IIB family hydrolase [Butyrivibrio sp. NC3005]|uniref:Cof-type HAD-IIB family hydrolase n=1 Tax=Butyrivibrio sp. NC3005 TaxID=1280685 RepID=UPI00041FB679|nr:Cof-type HAD-IIB family hydrolase [Butyrivibrio sp. NC3005]
MNYRAIALDLDGTLTNSKKEVSKRNKDAVKMAAQKGIKIIIATGRPTPGVTKISHVLELDKVGGYVLAYNGGLIIDCKSGEVVRRETIPTEYYHTIVSSARRHGVTALTYDSEGIITENDKDEYAHIEARINGIPVKKVFQLDRVAANDPVVKFLIVGEPKKLKPVYDDLKEKMEGKVTIFYSEPYFLEVMPNGIEKASSLELLLNKLDIDRKYLMACGDGFNDIPMLKYAGLAVAMENAQEETKQWADFIAPSNDEDGVGIAIEKFI